MNRILHTLTRVGGLTSLATRREGGSLAAWIALIAVLETIGGSSRSDAMDALAVTTLVVALGATLRAQRTQPLQWLAPLAAGIDRLLRGVRQLGVEFGVDMREQPPLRRGAPRLIWVLLVAAFLVFAGSALGLARWPEALRGLATLSYTLYLLTLGALWAALLAGVVFSGGITLCALHDALLDARHRHRLGLERGWLLRARESHFGVALLLGVLIASFLLPAVVAIGLIVGLWGLHAALLVAARVHLPLLWIDERGEPRVLPWIGSGLALTSIALLVTLAPTLLAIGDELLHFSSTTALEGPMPITRALGRLFAWAALLAFTTFVYLGGRVTRTWWNFRRARGAARELRVLGLDDPRARRALAAGLEPHGWRLHFGAEPRREALDLRVERGAPLPSSDLFGPSWPAVVPPEWLTGEQGLAKLERRWHKRQRRRLVRGLKSLFKGLSARQFARGEGTWVAPNLWYVTGLSRDTGEGPLEHEEDYLLDEHIGPGFAEVFPWSVRVHFHELMRALEVDLIFVEDGVRFRRFRRVLDALFELHDVHGGEQRAEERHFNGLPGISVVVVEIGQGDTLDSDKYPEPDYEDVGRARILHVFRERGGDVEDALEPEDVTWTPISEWGPLVPSA